MMTLKRIDEDKASVFMEEISDEDITDAIFSRVRMEIAAAQKVSTPLSSNINEPSTQEINI